MQNRMRRWCLTHLFVCSCDSTVRFWTQKIQANVDYCHVWRREETRRVHFARPSTQASTPAPTDFSLAAKRRRGASRGIFFKQASEPSTMTYAAAVCTRMMICSHERRALGALLFFASRSEPASTDDLTAERPGDCLRASSL